MSLAALMDRNLAAWNARDPEAIAADFAPSGTYASPTLVDRDRPGPEAVAADARLLFTAFPDFRLSEHGRILDEAGGCATMLWRCDGTFRGPLDPPGYAPTNGPVSSDGVTWVEVEDGHITRFHLYYDLNELGRQIGAMPPPGSPGEKMVVTFQKLAAKGLRKRDWSS